MTNFIKKLFLYLALAAMTVYATSATAGFVPYGRIFKAVKDERPYITQAQDTRLQLQLHKKILLNYPETLTRVSSYVFIGHVFLVGEVENDTERDGLLKCVESFNGLNGISFYLPQNKQTDQDTASELEISLKGMLEPDYPSSKVTVKVVQDCIVILGVLNIQEQESVLKAVQRLSGSSRIINFLQAPQQPKKQRKKNRPLRNFLRD